MFGSSNPGRTISPPKRTMGIDKSLTDEFPSVYINGIKYHYGRKSAHGQYIVENAEYAKDYWCFDRAADLRAFLVNLPESADREWFHRSHDDWETTTSEQRERYAAERRTSLRHRMEEKDRLGTAGRFNVLSFDDDAAAFYSVYAGQKDPEYIDDVEVSSCEADIDDKGHKAKVIQVSHRWHACGPLKLGREQAFELASALIRAALNFEPNVEADK
jgi:hypothetical protein